ncbi:MmgE/PrpD family protein [uncultured Jatrophihabitans sp.]|uniref:MmgE/PrpD family protein n=1 Tax=uncultured Jatrophihabitans sp. TaxID=1610747 RepID=UPI0035CA29D3
MTDIATRLATWADALGSASQEVAAEDVALAQRSLVDTVAVTLAARSHPLGQAARVLSEPGRWAVLGHVLDFDDLHMPSTTHVSVVCVPAVLAAGGDARAYLAAAGVMARLGTALGWPHYAAGWHATCTAGAPAAAVAAASSWGLSVRQTAVAIALAVPAAGGVQRAFGSDAKSLQVGFAAEAGLRAARLARAGADADTSAVDAWLPLVGGDVARLDTESGAPALPDGLAIKIYPACYALQRPISALAGLGIATGDVTRIVARSPVATVAPLIHHRPTTGLQGKFSLEYACATALLDAHQGFASFADDAVRRAEAQRLVRLVEIQLTPGGNGLLSGAFEAEVYTGRGVETAWLDLPPGAPRRPPTPEQLAAKVTDCLGGLTLDPQSWTWSTAADVLREHLG